jgi:hypothetical protein
MPFAASTDRGVMARSTPNGGYGYAATADTSSKACGVPWSAPRTGREVTARTALFDSRSLPVPAAHRHVPHAGLRRSHAVAA